MRLIHYKRLLKLARHLESGKLFHNRFDYRIISQETSCGTVGCAVGEAMHLFGKKRPGVDNYAESVNLFGISSEEYGFLFCPQAVIGLKSPLSPYATEYEVALHIRKFVMDKLRVVRPRVKTEPCPVCEGSGKVEIVHKEDAKCHA